MAESYTIEGDEVTLSAEYPGDVSDDVSEAFEATAIKAVVDCLAGKGDTDVLRLSRCEDTVCVDTLGWHDDLSTRLPGHSEEDVWELVDEVYATREIPLQVEVS